MDTFLVGVQWTLYEVSVLGQVLHTKFSVLCTPMNLQCSQHLVKSNMKCVLVWLAVITTTFHSKY